MERFRVGRGPEGIEEDHLMLWFPFRGSPNSGVILVGTA